MLYLHENVFMKRSTMRKKCTHIKTLRERLAVALLRDEHPWGRDFILQDVGTFFLKNSSLIYHIPTSVFPPPVSLLFLPSPPDLLLLHLSPDNSIPPKHIKQTWLNKLQKDQAQILSRLDEETQLEEKGPTSRQRKPLPTLPLLGIP